MTENNIDDEDLWVTPPHFSPSNKLHRSLRDLEHGLRCPCCKEFFRNPVSVIPCQHSFCSECIRIHFKNRIDSTGNDRKPACPVCREVVNAKGGDYEKCLVPNRSIETMTVKFQALRSGLHSALTVGASQATTSQTMTEKTTNAENGASAASTRRRSERVSYDENVEEEQEEEDAKPAPRLEKKSKVYYHGKKRAELKELCAREGLSVTGNERDLRTRHENYIRFYNSHCDSFHRRTEEELRTEFNRAEAERAALARRNQRVAITMQALKKSRKRAGEAAADEDVHVSSGNVIFDAQLDAGFSKLIAEHKQRAMKNKKQKTAAATDEERNDASLENEEEEAPASDDDEKKLAATEDDEKKPPAEMETTKSIAVGNSSSSAGRKSSPPGVVSGSSADTEDVDFTEEPSTKAIAAAEAMDVEGNGTSLSSAKKRPVQQSSLKKATMHKSANPNFFNARRLSSGKDSLIGPWTCGLCTYDNERNRSSRAKCEMCGNPRNATP
jgi:hypothetical protein